MKEFIHKLKPGPTLYIVVGLVLLPLLVGGVYLVNIFSSHAETGCVPTNVHSQRVSVSAATVTFDTACEVTAQVMCSAGRGGVQFLCGEDTAPSTHHVLSTSDVTLSTNVGYYTFIDTKVPQKTLGYIPASPTNPTYGLQFDDLDSDSLGTKVGEVGYDPALDINQDGVITVLDKVAFYDK